MVHFKKRRLVSLIPSEILQAARKTNLVDFCNRNGIEIHKEDKHENYRTVGFGGLILKENYFVHFSDNQRGGNAIDFVRLTMGCGFADAVKMLTDYQPIEIMEKKPLEAFKAVLEAPTKAENNKRVIAYLSQKRFIDYEIIIQFIKEGLIFQDSNGNAVFSWKNFEGNVVGYNKRGTIDKGDFKQNLVGSDFDIGFTKIIGIPKQLLAFESVIDLLSVLTIKKMKNEVLQNVILIATNNLNDRPIKNALKYFKSIEKVFICFDNDEPAREFISNLELEIPFEAVIPKAKDWNEQLAKLKKKGEH